LMTAQGSEETAFDVVLSRACRGDADALGELFRAFHPRVLRYLRARDLRRAEDVAGETWLAVARGIGSFNGDAGAFSAWIFTIARQRLADQLRTGARRRTDPVADPAAFDVAVDQDAAIEALAGQEAVDQIMASLSPDQAEVVLLRVLGGLSAAQVAHAMGREETWVRVTHHRAIARLRARVANDSL